MGKSIFDKQKMISGATQMGEAVLGAGATTYAINKIPAGKIKKFVPGTVVAGSLAVCLFTDNTHARSLALGSGIAGSIALVKQFTEEKPATATTEQTVSGFAGVKDVLKSAFIVEGGFSEELGNAYDMNEDYMVDNFIEAYSNSPATEPGTLLGLGNISNLI